MNKRTNYTQQPNVLVDEHLDSIETLTELKITLYVIRHTVGFSEKPFIKKSIRKMAKKTGLALRSIQRALPAINERGLIYVKVSGGKYEWGQGRLITLDGDDDKSSTLEMTNVVQSIDKSSTVDATNVVQFDDKSSTPTTYLKDNLINNSIKDNNSKETTTTTQEILPPLSKHDVVINKFTELTALIPPHNSGGTYDTKWYHPVDSMLNLCGNNVDKAITLLAWCVDFANGNNDQGKTYRILSPKSLLGIFETAANGDGKRATGGEWEAAWDLLYQLALKDNHLDIPADLLPIVRPIWPQIAPATNGRIGQLKQDFRKRYMEMKND